MDKEIKALEQITALLEAVPVKDERRMLEWLLWRFRSREAEEAKRPRYWADFAPIGA